MSERPPASEEDVTLLEDPGHQPPASSPHQDSVTGDGQRAMVIDVPLPEDPDEAIAFLLDALRASQEEATGYLGDLQRVAAEFENYRKRALRERDDFSSRATQGLVKDLLPVLDSFDGAMTAIAGLDERVVAGIRSTHDLLRDVLAREGLESIPAAGMTFDPAHHEAVSGGGTGHLVVTAELRRGYTLRGRVVRPTLVAVASEDLEGGETG